MHLGAVDRIVDMLPGLEVGKPGLALRSRCPARASARRPQSSCRTFPASHRFFRNHPSARRSGRSMGRGRIRSGSSGRLSRRDAVAEGFPCGVIANDKGVERALILRKELTVAVGLSCAIGAEGQCVEDELVPTALEAIIGRPAWRFRKAARYSASTTTLARIGVALSLPGARERRRLTFRARIASTVAGGSGHLRKTLRAKLPEVLGHRAAPIRDARR